MEQEHHDEGTGTGRDEATSTQGTEATGIHTTTIGMTFFSLIQGLCPPTYLLMLLCL